MVVICVFNSVWLSLAVFFFARQTTMTNVFKQLHRVFMLKIRIVMKDLNVTHPTNRGLYTLWVLK